jgi:hypothetical protein
MKKTRLLEIIREEISLTLREGEMEEKAAKMAQLKATDLEIKALQKKKSELSKTGVAESELNEDIIAEGPFIEGPLDFAYIDGKVEKGILGKAIAKATQEIKKVFPDTTADSAAKIITSKKSRTSEKTPESIKSALEKIDSAIDAQIDTFDDVSLLKDLLNKKEIGNSPEEIDRINSYIKPGEDGEIKTYVEKLGFPQTERAVKKALQGKAPVDVEPETSSKPAKTTEPKATNKPASEPKTATLTKGDDGFDDVSYSEPKAEKPKTEKPKTEKPKTAETDKATAAASKTPKLDKLSKDKDALLDTQKETQAKMRELATKIRGAEASERESLTKELKNLNKLNGEIQTKLDKLF